jgi:hypothetical protein
MGRRRDASDPDPASAERLGEPTSSPHSHDALFKKTFAVPEHALDLIRQRLPAELLAALDPGSLQRDSEHHIDEVSLGETRTDVLFTARLRGDPVLIYVLIEHQSTQDPLMAFRLLRYVVRIWERWLADATAAANGVSPTTLPPVIPLVVYQGPRPWAVARSLAESIPLPPALAPHVRPLLPGLDLSILDLGEGGPDALRAWRAEPRVKVTLAIMRAAVEPGVDMLAVYRAYSGELALLVRRRDGREALALLARYTLSRRSNLDVAALAAVVAEAAGRTAGDVVMSTAQELINEGLQQGVQQGVRQEREQTLLRQLRVKFGRLPGDVARRLAAASLEDLGRWTEQILVAERLEDVFTTATARPRRSSTRRPRKR